MGKNTKSKTAQGAKQMRSINKIFKIQNEAYLKKLIEVLIDVKEIWESTFTIPYADHEETTITNKKRNIIIIINIYSPDSGLNKTSLKINNLTSKKFTKREIRHIIKACSICERNQMIYRKLSK